GQTLRGSNMPGKNDRPGNRPVEPMGQPQIDIALLLLAVAVKCLYSNFHAIDAGGRLSQHAGGVVHHEASPVVVQDFEFRFWHEMYVRPSSLTARDATGQAGKPDVRRTP